MSSQELKELLDYIQERNSWENMMKAVDNDRYCYKYLDLNICYDTRDTNNGQDPHIWNIRLSLRECGKIKEFNESECTLQNIKNFLDLPIKEALEQMKDIKR